MGTGTVVPVPGRSGVKSLEQNADGGRGLKTISWKFEFSDQILTLKRLIFRNRYWETIEQSINVLYKVLRKLLKLFLKKHFSEGLQWDTNLEEVGTLLPGLHITVLHGGGLDRLPRTRNQICGLGNRFTWNYNNFTCYKISEHRNEKVYSNIY